jgi:rare lipoprotein A
VTGPRLALLALLAVGIAGCSASRPPTTRTTAKPPPERPPRDAGAAPRGDVLEVHHGRAVWYGGKHHGGPTASGERFDKHAMTAAHRDLPLGSVVRVTNQRNGKSVVVRINDRGPYGKDRRRNIDVSEAAAKKLDFLRAGWTEVKIEVLEKPARQARKKSSKRKRKPKRKEKR